MKIAMGRQPLAVAAKRWPTGLALVAAACFAAAVGGFGILLQGQVPSLAAIDVFGAAGMPGAAVFNTCAFIVPGALVGAVAVAAYLGSGSAIVRIGGWIVLFSALAFAGHGLFPLDPAHREASARLHASCWSLWWLTTATGASLVGLGQRDRNALWRAATVAIALLVPFFALFAPPVLGGAIAQRIAYGMWFAWWILAATTMEGMLNRSGASAPGSSPPARR